MGDASNGYDALASAFLHARSRIGASSVREWADTLGPGARVLDVGCGHGFPITEVLVAAGCQVSAIDASPAMLDVFRARFPDVPVLCEPVQLSSFFGRSFDGVVAWGLLFLLPAEVQIDVIHKLGAAVAPGGQLLFTSPLRPSEWLDAMTGLGSVSLGADAYRRAIESSGLTLLREFDDEGDNHYYVAARARQP
jgi:2-polyprenyl-3-methyl-5-hydroxy-6-metoxy-1,4-benzoquinol methylase